MNFEAALNKTATVELLTSYLGSRASKLNKIGCAQLDMQG